ncbi:hypothetical protein [Neorhizobium sp. LjRoot104]|uniref:hypothetical protein n=1 Tax=Neorhizobium sp. LjRoot104 TaxID=3342254 RepID=UPI003ECCDB68
MTETYPKDGSTFVLESIERIAYRWAKYKPDGARQMGKPGRWQRQVWSGDYFKWENCGDPVGVLSPAEADGPISTAVNSFEAHKALISDRDAVISKLRSALSDILGYDRNFYDNGRPGYEAIAREALNASEREGA